MKTSNPLDLSTDEVVPTAGPVGDRRTAAAVGVLYIIGTVAGISSYVMAGGLEGPNYVADAAAAGNRLVVGALLVMTMAVALALIPVVVYPVLRVTSERLAAGYLVFRGALETMTYMVTVVAWLALFQLGRDDGTAAAGGADAGADGLRSAGLALHQLDEMGGTIGTVVFLIGAAMFYWALYRADLVPRWLSGWGLLAIVPYLVAGLLKMFAVIDTGAPAEFVLSAPLGVQEMVLAVWLIVRGFNQPAARPG